MSLKITFSTMHVSIKLFSFQSLKDSTEILVDNFTYFFRIIISKNIF